MIEFFGDYLREDRENQLFSDIDPEINHFSNLYPNFPSNFNCEYYDITKFNTLPLKSNHDLAIFHVNIRSLFNKIDQLYALLELLKTKFYIICLTESWLSESNKDLVNLPNFNSYHSLRQNS